MMFQYCRELNYLFRWFILKIDAPFKYELYLNNKFMLKVDVCSL